MTVLTLKSQPRALLEAEAIRPENLNGRPAAEIARLMVTHGNEPAALGDFFDVAGDGSLEIVLNGDLSRVKNIAARMTQGKILVNGHAGTHLGAVMQGGEIHVFGNAGDCAGAEMTGGKIHIHGDAGHALGGALRGSRRGMRRGLILVEGSAGNETGAMMRRGLIVIKGNAGDFTGLAMIAGSIIVFGKLGLRPGAGLVRGTIVTFRPAELLPSYRYDCCYQPDFLKMIFRDLKDHELAVPENFMSACFHRYSGDFNRLGKGEILIHDQR
jgi:formylmethanofuran dehydrogenase subunit C